MKLYSDLLHTIYQLSFQQKSDYQIFNLKKDLHFE